MSGQRALGRGQRAGSWAEGQRAGSWAEGSRHTGCVRPGAGARLAEGCAVGAAGRQQIRAAENKGASGRACVGCHNGSLAMLPAYYDMIVPKTEA